MRDGNISIMYTKVEIVINILVSRIHRARPILERSDSA